MTTETTDAQRKLGPADLFREQEATHDDVRLLHPLLSLLEEAEGSGSLDRITELLTSIVTILGTHSRMLDEIKAVLVAGHDGRNPTP